MAFVAIPYVVAGIALGTFGIAIWSLRWPRVKGTMDVSIYDRESEAESTGPDAGLQKRGRFSLAYSYSVNGTAFQAARIAPLVEFDWQLSNAPDLSSAYDRSKWYRQGAIIDVSYCPLLPQWSCLEPGGFGVALVLGVLAVILFFFA